MVVANKPWKRVHLNFAGPFQGAMFLVAVDSHSKWPEVFIMSTTTVSKTIEVLRVMFAAYGLPEQIVLDNGPQFISSEFATFLKQNGVKHICSAPYHPSTSGLAERFIQPLKQSLKATQNTGRSLSHRLYDFLFTYHQSVHSTTGKTPSSLFLQRELGTRFHLLQPDQEARALAKQYQQKSGHDLHARGRQFFFGQSVMAKRSKVDSCSHRRTARSLSYLAETKACSLWRRHVDLLKELSSADTVPTVSTPHAAVGAEVVLPASHRPPVISGSVPEPARVTTPEDVRSSEAPISRAAAPTATSVRVPSTAVAVPTSLPHATETSMPTVPP